MLAKRRVKRFYRVLPDGAEEWLWCAACGKQLKTPESRRRGVGPKCGRNLGAEGVERAKGRRRRNERVLTDPAVELEETLRMLRREVEQEAPRLGELPKGETEDSYDARRAVWLANRARLHKLRGAQA